LANLVGGIAARYVIAVDSQLQEDDENEVGDGQDCYVYHTYAEIRGDE
jgi:hypothetical protein